MRKKNKIDPGRRQMMHTYKRMIYDCVSHDHKRAGQPCTIHGHQFQFTHKSKSIIVLGYFCCPCC